MSQDVVSSAEASSIALVLAESSSELAQVEHLAMPEDVPGDQRPATVYIASLSLKSRRVAESDLHTIAGIVSAGRLDAFTLDWGQLRFTHTAAIRATLAERYTYSGANRMLSMLRQVLKTAWRLEQIPTEQYQRAVDFPGIKGETLPAGRALATGELRALFDVCVSDRAPAGARDAALLAVMYGCGLRRSEVVALDLSDYDREDGALIVRHGKGNKARTVYPQRGGVEALAAWLDYRGVLDGPLFLPLTKNGRVMERRLTDQAVLDMLTKRAKQAGITEVSPHDFRRTFITHLLDAGENIAVVQKLAGHSNVATTARYDRSGEQAKRKASEALVVPYMREDAQEQPRRRKKTA